MTRTTSIPRWQSLLALAINIAGQHCRASFDPHVTLAVFQYIRTNPQARRIYLSATGAHTGFEEDQEGKNIANPLIGREIAKHFQADAVEWKTVEGEFITGYSVLATTKWRAAR